MQPRGPLRRITTCLAILGYTLVASGLPLPFGMVAPAAPDSPAAKRLAGKDRSQPFPCMDKTCGCVTAEQCFTSCCCNTPAETLAWAEAHAVEPAVLAALERRVAGGTHGVAKAVKPSCCSTKAPVKPLVAEASCCANAQPESEAIARDQAPPSDDAPSLQPRSRSLTLRAMLACGGIVAEWFAAGAALPPLRIELALAMSVCDECMPGDESGEGLRSSPTAPPPRAV